jgi:membrane fusion protein, multidrug efflux system
MRFETLDPMPPSRPGRRSTHRHARALLAACAAALLLTTLSGCGAKKAQRQPRVAVTVARVEQRTMPVQIVTTGTIEPVETADVGSQVGGVVTRIAFREGQEVRAGQTLIELDPRPFRAALEQAGGALARDQAQWRSARLDAERADQLLAQSLISTADHDRTTAAAEALGATVRTDSGTVAKARLDLEFAGIRAPISGRTGSLNVHVGDLVKSATSEPLVTINRVQPIRVRFTVSQEQIPLVQRHRDAALKVYVRQSPGDSIELEGHLAFVDNAVDRASGTLLLKGEIANRDGALWPGEFVEVRLVLAVERNAIVVPAQAVTTGQQGAYVYVLNADSTAVPRPVTVKRSDEVTAVLSSGLRPGETVITDGQFRLAPGAKVLVRRTGQEARP